MIRHLRKTVQRLRRSLGKPDPGSGGGPLDSSLWGVNLVGYIRAEMGIGEAARGLASALDASGVPFGIIDYEVGNPSRQNDETWLHRLVDEPTYGINILHVNADLVAKARRHLGRRLFKNRYTIGFWAWELPDFPDRWQSSFDLVDEIWTPSSFVMKAVAQKSTKPVHCFPHPIAKGPGPYLDRVFFKLPERPFLFLSMYDLHSIPQRKNPYGSIMAFKTAFRPDDPEVGLVLKVNNANKREWKALQELIGRYRNIYLVDQVLSRHQVDSLLAACDCFVSLHRSEGFGLVLAEAMGLGRPVIGTGWSGNMEFMNQQNSVCVKYELKKLGKRYGPYDAKQYWAEPDLLDAAEWMVRLREEPQLAAQLAEQGRQDVERLLSPRAIGDRIKEHLTSLSPKG